MAVGYKKFTMEYVVPKIKKNLKERFDTKQKAFKSIDEKGKGLSLQKRSDIKKSFSGKASKIFDDASKARKGKMGGGMMGRRMNYKVGKLVGNQKKIDVAAPFGTINARDFKKLREGKRMQASVGGGAGQTIREKEKFQLDKNISKVKKKMSGPRLTKSQEDTLRDRMKQPLKRKKP